MSEPSLAENAAGAAGAVANMCLISALTESAFDWPILPIAPPFWVSALALVGALILVSKLNRARQAADAEAKAQADAEERNWAEIRAYLKAEEKAERKAKRKANREAERTNSEPTGPAVNSDAGVDAEGGGSTAGADTAEAGPQSADSTGGGQGVPAAPSDGSDRVDPHPDELRAEAALTGREPAPTGPATAHAETAVGLGAETATRPANGLGATGNILAACGVFLSAAQLLVSIVKSP